MATRVDITKKDCQIQLGMPTRVHQIEKRNANYSKRYAKEYIVRNGEKLT